MNIHKSHTKGDLRIIFQSLKVYIDFPAPIGAYLLFTCPYLNFWSQKVVILVDFGHFWSFFSKCTKD